MVNCIKITDLTAPELDVYARRSERQLLNRDDPAKGLFIAESPLVIGRALDAGYRPVSCLLEEGDAAGQARAGRPWRCCRVFFCPVVGGGLGAGGRCGTRRHSAQALGGSLYWRRS